MSRDLSVRLQAYLHTTRREDGPGDIFLDYKREIGATNNSHVIRQLIMEFSRAKKIIPQLQEVIQRKNAEIDILKEKLKKYEGEEELLVPEEEGSEVDESVAQVEVSK